MNSPAVKRLVEKRLVEITDEKRELQAALDKMAGRKKPGPKPAAKRRRKRQPAATTAP